MRPVESPLNLFFATIVYFFASICKFIIMALKVYSAKQYSVKLKCTIQKTGKLGFTSGTANALKLNPDSYIKIASDDEQVGVLYLIVCDRPDEDGFNVDYISGYYSLPTTVLFNELGIDYKNFTIMYDLSREASLDVEVCGTVYKMTKRANPKKKKETDMV